MNKFSIKKRWHSIIIRFQMINFYQFNYRAFFLSKRKTNTENVKVVDTRLVVCKFKLKQPSKE